MKLPRSFYSRSTLEVASDLLGKVLVRRLGRRSFAGKIVETASVRELFNNPRHPYTKALIGSMPKLGSKEKLLAIPGQPPDLATLPPGCAFHPRCPEALARCVVEEPDADQREKKRQC